MPKIIKPAHRKGKRHCIFCGQPNRISKEHIFPKWLRRLFPRDHASSHIYDKQTWPNHVLTPHPTVTRRTRQGHPGEIKARTVCKECNEGWMSSLEEWAKANMPSLIKATPLTLMPSGQAGLATWAAKTAMVYESFDPPDRGVEFAERSRLRETLTPPENWRIFAGAYDGHDWRDLRIAQDCRWLSNSARRDPKSFGYYAQATTIGLGHLILLVIGSSSPFTRPTFDSLGWTDLTQIWPIDGHAIQWPTERILDDRAVKIAANILSDITFYNRPLYPLANPAFATRKPQRS